MLMSCIAATHLTKAGLKWMKTPDVFEISWRTRAFEFMITLKARGPLTTTKKA